MSIRVPATDLRVGDVCVLHLVAPVTITSVVRQRDRPMIVCTGMQQIGSRHRVVSFTTACEAIHTIER